MSLFIISLKILHSPPIEGSKKAGNLKDKVADFLQITEKLQINSNMHH
jgi:hypothetical protein